MLSKEAKELLLAKVDEGRALEHTRALLKIPSFCGKEREKSLYLAELLKGLGLRTSLEEVEPGRPNLIAKLKGGGEGPTLILNGHLDHNMVVEGWTVDPFAAIVKGGWLYGFVHMQSALGAYLAALEALLHSGLRIRGELMLQFVVGELQGGLGTQHALKRGHRGDYYVVGEPTNLSITTHYSGRVLVRLNIVGRSKHFTTQLPPGEKGISALEQMVKVVMALGRSHKKIEPGGWLTFEPREGWRDWPQLNVGSMRCGIGRECQDWRPALLPDFCTILIDFRTLPGQNAETIERDLMKLLEGLKAAGEDELRYELEVLDGGFPSEGFEEPQDTPIFYAVYNAHLQALGRPPAVNSGYPKLSDALHLSKAGIRGIVYGPAGKFTSQPDERVEIWEIGAAAKVYALTMGALLAEDG